MITNARIPREGAENPFIVTNRTWNIARFLREASIDFDHSYFDKAEKAYAEALGLLVYMGSPVERIKNFIRGCSLNNP